MTCTIAALCADYFNESVHTEHVTALALHLFDHTHRRLGLPATDRPLLEAAGRLHDVAYSLNPLHHSEASAELILREGIRGYRQEQLPVIVATMLLHGGNLTSVQNHILFHEISAAQRQHALRLGAFLRVADGLDYGHIQNARITGIRRDGKAIEVAVASPLFDHNLVRAQRKADLWRKVFPLDIRFVPAAFDDEFVLVTGDTSIPEAARRLLSFHYKTLLVNIDGAIEGHDSEPLRRVRIAIRRLGAILQIFRKHLPKELTESIADDLRELSRELGPARDLDVWFTFLRKESARPIFSSSRLWGTFLQYQERRRRLQDETIRRCLRGAHFGGLRHRIARLLRAELPRLAAKKSPKRALEKLARKRFAKSVRAVRKRARLRHSAAGDKLHKLRVTMRRARYIGDFFAPVLGPADHKLVRRMRQAERLLSGVHDVDVALEFFVPQGPTPPRALVKLLRKRRADYLDQLDRAWERLNL